MYLEWPNRIWAAPLDLLLFLDFRNFCERTPRNKLCGSTHFIIFGLMDQKLWMFDNLRGNLGRAGMCWSQPTRVDYISPKRWVAGIRNFEKSPLRIFSPIFWTLPLHLEGWNLPFLIELEDFIFFQILFLLNLEYIWAFISTVEVFV
jgi:hypothetical protein